MNWIPLNNASSIKPILDVELSGIGLAGEKLERFNQIAQELSKLATDFSNNVLDATKAFELIVTDPADMEGCPNSLKQLSSQAFNQGDDDAGVKESTPEDGPWKITLDIPSYLPFMEHCRNADLREQVYRAFVSRASADDLDNAPLIAQILKLRQEKASLLGYGSFAELSLATKMAPSVEKIEEMEKQLLAASKPGAEQDLSEITALAQENGHVGDLLHWDVAFWAERLREQKFEYTDDELRPYFPMPRVLNGLYEVIHRLFDVTIKETDAEVSVWNKDVRFYKVFNNAGEQIAGFYLDPYSRPEDKRGGAWMNTCLDRRMSNGYSQLSVAIWSAMVRLQWRQAVFDDLLGSRHVVPRVWTWLASHVDHHRFRGCRRHQWCRVGRGRVAESIYGKLVLPSTHLAGNDGTLRNGRTIA